MGSRLHEIMMIPDLVEAHQLVISLVHAERIYHAHFKVPQPHLPLPLVVALKSHGLINQMQLISSIVIIHFIVIVVGNIAPKKFEQD